MKIIFLVNNFIDFFCYQYTMQDLLERIQASEEEIKTHLENIHACQIDGNLMGFFNSYTHFNS